MYEATASCKDIARTPVNKLGTPMCNARRILCAVRHGMKVQLVTPYCVSRLQRYGVTVRGNVTSVYLTRTAEAGKVSACCIQLHIC
jgi:hypothetical protein